MRCQNNCADFVSLHLLPIDNNQIQLLKVYSENYGLSSDYNFHIELMSEKFFPTHELIGHQAKLSWHWQDQKHLIHGSIYVAEFLDKNADYYSYRLGLHSPLAQLKHNQHHQVFVDKNVLDILTTLLKNLGWQQGVNFNIDTKCSYPNLPLTIQYNETDYDFLERLLARYGIFYYFQQDDDRAKLVFLDETPSCGEMKLCYCEQSHLIASTESIYSICSNIRYLPDYVAFDTKIKSSNHRGIKGHGVLRFEDMHYGSEENGWQLAQILQQQLDWQRQTYLAYSDCPGLKLGNILHIYAHPQKKFNQAYRIIHIRYLIDQSERSAKPTWQSQLTLIPLNKLYRKPTLLTAASSYHETIDTELDNQTCSPAVIAPYFNGIVTAKIVSLNAEYADLDELGFYHIRFPFDNSDNPPSQLSPPLPLMQAYLGTDYGQHFHLRAGTEVAIACLYGNMDNPIILGVLTNPVTPSPVNSHNHSQNILRTFAGNELMMEDLEEKNYLKLHTQQEQNSLYFQTNNEHHQINLTSAHGQINLYAHNNMQIHSGGSYSSKSYEQQVTVTNQQTLQTYDRGIELQAGKHILLQAERDLLLQSKTNDVNFYAGKKLTIHSEQNYSQLIKNKNLDIKTTQGNAYLHAEKLAILSGKEMTIATRLAGITMNKDGQLNFYGKNLIIEAPEIIISGASNFV